MVGLVLVYGVPIPLRWEHAGAEGAKAFLVDGSNVDRGASWILLKKDGLHACGFIIIHPDISFPTLSLYSDTASGFWETRTRSLGHTWKFRSHVQNLLWFHNCLSACKPPSTTSFINAWTSMEFKHWSAFRIPKAGIIMKGCRFAPHFVSSLLAQVRRAILCLVRWKKLIMCYVAWKMIEVGVWNDRALYLLG